MNRDTTVALWYRRIDPSCFTTEHLSRTGVVSRRSIVPVSDDRAVRETRSLAAATAQPDWSPRVEHRRWSLGAIGDRLATVVAFRRTGHQPR